jgi:propionyl-CoA carboxylase beta chain
MTHNATSGVAHFAVTDDRECLLQLVRELLGYLPSNNVDDPPHRETADPPDREDPALDALVPLSAEPAVRHARSRTAPSSTTASSRGAPALREEHRRRVREAGGASWDRRQPARAPGRMPRHRRIGQGGPVRPLLRRVQHPARHVRGRALAFCPGTRQEHGGIIRHGAKLLFAFAEATVPKLTVITRKAYGGAYCVMASKHLRTDVNSRIRRPRLP